MAINKLCTGLLALAALSCGEEPPVGRVNEVYLDFSNRAGSHYSMDLAEYDGKFLDKKNGGIVHFMEPMSKDDFIVKERDYIIVTNGTPESPSGTQDSLTRILVYLGHFKAEGKYCFAEFADIGSKGGIVDIDIVKGKTGELEGTNFGFLEFPENPYMFFIDLKSGLVAFDQNGYKSHKGDLVWGEKMLITKEDGSMIDLESLLGK